MNFEPIEGSSISLDLVPVLRSLGQILQPDLVVMRKFGLRGGANKIMWHAKQSSVHLCMSYPEIQVTQQNKSPTH